MAPEDRYGLGYRRPDSDPNVDVLVATMEATGRWGATQTLRGWERQHLALRAGERVLDVGCGLGDAALVLAEDLAPSGELVGIDVSAAMLAVARERASRSPCAVRFLVGDARALDELDESFDVVRCERTLQWIPEPDGVVGEMARVLRTGGRMSLIDTDWSTFRLDVGEPLITNRVANALRRERSRPSRVGGRLESLLADAGLDVLAATQATHHWTEWDPHRSAAPDGCFSMSSLAQDLVDAGQLHPEHVDRFVTDVHEAARQGRFKMSLTMFAAVGVRIAPRQRGF